MATKVTAFHVVLALDIGAVNTRALLFDVVEGRYRLIAMGTAPTTAYAPWHDVREGVHRAIEEVERITGRPILTADAQLLVPSEGNAGVDKVVITLSAGRPLRTVCLGVLEEASLASAVHLAESTYAEVVGRFHLNDRMRLEQRLDAIVAARPDVVILAGGTDGGASRAVEEILETAALAAYLLPEGSKPMVLFAGNQALRRRVEQVVSQVAEVRLAPNVRPRLDVEQLGPAHRELVALFRQVHLREILGLQELHDAAEGHLYPTATGIGRVVQHLSKVYDPAKGVLAVDLGASAAVLAGAWNGRLSLKVYPDLGLGENLPALLRQTHLQRITTWLPLPIEEDDVVDYLYTKALYPDSVPVTQEDLAVELALAREVLRVAVRRAQPDFLELHGQRQWPFLPPLEPILLSGSVFTRSPHPAHSVLLALDGIQPIGVTTLVLDQSHLLGPLGAAAAVDPVLTVQVMESHHLVPLATVAAPLWEGRYGAPLLEAMVEYASGDTMRVELKAGRLEVLPLPLGQQARLILRPRGGVDVGAGPGRTLRMRVNGSVVGVVLDGRGRPLRLPSAPDRRRELLQRWLWALGA